MDNEIFKSCPEEFELIPQGGWTALILSTAAYFAAILGVIGASFLMDVMPGLGAFAMVVFIAYLSLGWIFWLGLRVVRPNEALVLTLFGRYIGTIMKEGFYYVNPFSTAVYPQREHEAARAAAMPLAPPPRIKIVIGVPPNCQDRPPGAAP